MHGPKRLKILNSVERAALERLRCGATAAATPTFAALTAFLRQEGVRVQEPNAPFVNSDEDSLLGCLAWAQRGWRDHRGPSSPLLRELLSACAAELGEAGWHLPYRAMQRLGFGRPVTGPSAAVEAVERSAATRGRRASIVALIRERGSMTSRELGALGFSRQYLSLLCKSGFLVRPQSGLYRAP